ASFNPPTAPSSGGTFHQVPQERQGHVSTHPPLLRAVGRSTKFPRSAKVMFQPTHRSFERWDLEPLGGSRNDLPVSTHPPLLRAVGPATSSPRRSSTLSFNPPTAPSSGATLGRQPYLDRQPGFNPPTAPSSGGTCGFPCACCISVCFNPPTAPSSGG